MIAVSTSISSNTTSDYESQSEDDNETRYDNEMRLEHEYKWMDEQCLKLFAAGRCITLDLPAKFCAKNNHLRSAVT